MPLHSSEPYLRIAAVQIDCQPLFRLPTGGSPISEPLVSEKSDRNFYLSKMREEEHLKNTCDELIKNAKSTYLDTYIQKLEDILNYCYVKKVDLLIFPEYSIPIEAIETLRRFSSNMTIVAGIAYLGRKDIEKLGNLNIDISSVPVGANAAIILSPEKEFLVLKKKPADKEDRKSVV